MGSSCPVKIYFSSKLKNCFASISPQLVKDWNNVWKVSEYLLCTTQLTVCSDATCLCVQLLGIAEARNTVWNVYSIYLFPYIGLARN